MTEAPIKLAGYFLEWQVIEDAKADLADRSKDLFKAMKDEGYDTKAARAVFREKRAELNAKPEDVAKAEEAEAIQDLYRAALDSGLTARAGRAREEQPEAATRRLDGFGSVQDGRKMSTNGLSAGVAEQQNDTVYVSVTDVTAGETAPHSQSAETPTADKPEAHAQPLSDASGSPFAGPRFSAVPGGEPSIPSSDDGGAKMDCRANGDPGRPDAMSVTFNTQSEQAATNSEDFDPSKLWLNQSGRAA